MKTIVKFMKNDVLTLCQMSLLKGGDGEPDEIPVILEPTKKPNALANNIGLNAMLNEKDKKEETNPAPVKTTGN